MRNLLTRSLLSTLLLALTAGAQTLVVNEFLASNDAGLQDPQGDFDDWVELFNYGAADVDIAGLYFTDGDEDLWQIPSGFPAETTITAGGYLLLWFDKDSEDGPLHVEAKLGGSGEAVYIYAADGTTVIDSIVYGPQIEDISYARVPDGSDDWQALDPPTPGETNGLPPVSPVVSGVNWSSDYVEAMTAVPIEAEVSDDGTVLRVDIFYSVDGGVETLLEMTDTGVDNLWTATIPGQPELSHLDFRVEAEDDDSGLTNDGPYAFDVLSASNELVINEIHYNPTEGGDYEFLELYNAGSTDVDISGWVFAEGVTDTIPGGTLVGAGAFYILASQADIFLVRYGFAADRAWLDGGLSNGGEDLLLLDASGFAMDYVDYDDGGCWVDSPDGDGPSLELIDPLGLNNECTAWQASFVDGGTPGASVSIAPPGVPVVSADVVGGSIVLEWLPVVDAVAYSIYVSDAAYGSYTFLQSTSATSLTLPINVDAQFYRVRATN